VTAVYQSESKTLLGVKIILTVAIINLTFLGFELLMNVIRTAVG
jgi:hypothetical protein